MNSYFVQNNKGIYSKLFHPCFGIRFRLLTRRFFLNASWLRTHWRIHYIWSLEGDQDHGMQTKLAMLQDKDVLQWFQQTTMVTQVPTSWSRDTIFWRGKLYACVVPSLVLIGDTWGLETHPQLCLTTSTSTSTTTNPTTPQTLRLINPNYCYHHKVIRR